jgi:pimeloyl-ACP methyl ester carboxylesterase
MNMTTLLSISKAGFIATFAALTVGCTTTTPETASKVSEAAPPTVACPEGVPTGTRCWRAKDSAGAPYLIAMPAQWSGVLVVHAHGGPFLGAPTDARGNEDLKRWAITVASGHAWAGSVFRQGGFAVTTAAEDTERVRQIFVDHVAKPKRTLLHGQSWGAMVATRAAEMFPKSWDGILLTSGVVGGPATYDFRLDLRGIYQYLCNNHPRPDEPTYSLALGLPADSKLTNADVAARVNECLGLNKPDAQRSLLQREKIKTIVDVVKIPASSIASHINWGTFTMADIARRHGGATFTNVGVDYRGSSEDAKLNAGVKRFAFDPAARQRFVADVDHTGRFAVPVLTTHGINDATVFVEGGDTLRARMNAAGNGERLVMTFVNSSEHSYLGDAIYPPLFSALSEWVDKGVKPNPQMIAERCVAMRSAQGDQEGAKKACEAYLPMYQVKPMASRVPPR